MRIQLSRACSSPEDAGVAAALPPGQERFSNQGVALIITLLLLFLLSVIGLAAVVSNSSDMMINGYYKNSRGSFYAADSGLNIARKEIFNYFQANSPSTWPTTQTGASTAGTTLASSATGALSGAVYSLNSNGQAGNSVPASFQITNPAVSFMSVSQVGSTQWTYIYRYDLTSVGASQGNASATIKERGTIKVDINQGSGTTTRNVAFSAFGAFIDSFAACQGALVQGYFTGPFYANGEWNLGSGSPGYTFTDVVSQTGSRFSYYDSSGRCTESASEPFTNSRGTINPSFQSGFALSVPPIALPTNTFSQQWAVLDGKGCGEGSNVCGDLTTPVPPQPTNAQMNALLKDVTQTEYPSAGTGSGVFLPYTCTSGTCSLNSDGGGIYVEASNSSVSTSVTLATTNGAGGSANPSGQVVTVAQTSGSTTATPVVTQTSTPSCSSTTSHHVTTYTCSASFQQRTTTTTPTTFTTVTVDPVAVATTVSSYIQTANSTLTKTGSNTCTSTSGNCSPSAPGSFSGGSTSDTSSDGAATTLNLSGVPEDLVGTTPQPATMVYVNGDVSITGPSSGAAIQNNSMVNVTANGDVTQTGNILYATKPVTTSVNQNVPGSSPPCCSGTPVDTLIPQFQNMNQVLGIFTANGNFILSPTNSGANIETDGSVAMISSAGRSNSNIGHMSTGNSVGTWTNIGGRIENRAHSVSINSTNVFYDRRFQARDNFAPPWFPATSVSQSVLTNTITAVSHPNTPSRTYWVYQAGQ